MESLLHTLYFSPALDDIESNYSHLISRQQTAPGDFFFSLNNYGYIPIEFDNNVDEDLPRFPSSFNDKIIDTLRKQFCVMFVISMIY